MSVPDRNGQPTITNQTEQYVLNYSFDEVYKILMVGLAAYNPSTGNYDRVQIGNDGGIKQANSNLTERYDIGTGVYYLGAAPIGTSEATAAWTITKIDTGTNPYTSKVATDISWTNRATGEYA